MRLAVIIPVGPGHEEIAARAIKSVWDAVLPTNRSIWECVDVCDVRDHDGEAGRSKARNVGILHRAWGADWVFLLDADDTMMPDALTIPMPQGKDALFGPAHALYWPKHRERKPAKQLTTEPPRTWDELLRQGPIQSYMMGNFYRATALRNHLFREDLDHGEDWEHHLSFLAKHEWAVSATPLALADSTHPSAGGPRGGAVRWGRVSEPFFKFWRKRGRIPLTKEERETRYWE